MNTELLCKYLSGEQNDHSFRRLHNIIIRYYYAHRVCGNPSRRAVKWAVTNIILYILLSSSAVGRRRSMMVPGFYFPRGLVLIRTRPAKQTLVASATGECKHETGSLPPAITFYTFPFIPRVYPFLFFFSFPRSVGACVYTVSDTAANCVIYRANGTRLLRTRAEQNISLFLSPQSDHYNIYNSPVYNNNITYTIFLLLRR